ncbi:MAG: SDR family NAD(P)-dependent oxidoreductase, partial [Nitrospinota bacterium]
MRLKDRTAIVTGAASGLGEAITKRFAREGAKVFACDRNQDGVEKLAAAISAEGLTVLPHVVDVSKSGEVRRAAETAIESFGRVDILINNAGISPKKAYLDYTEDDWDALLDVNLKGEYLCARAISEHM